VDYIRFCVRNPVTVLVGVIFVVLFGIVSFQALPYQLSPNVDAPVITVTTTWPGASPYEVERDILEEQEDVLKGVRNLYKMEGTASDGRGEVTLEFEVGTDIDDALLRVSNKLDEVPSYPENVDRPIMSSAGSEASPVIYMALKPEPGNDTDIYTYRTYLQNEITQFIERVPGVAEVEVFNGIEKEMQVRLKPEALASYGLTIDEVINVIRGDNATISAGDVSVGRFEVRVRSVNEYQDARAIENVVVTTDGQRRVRVGDLAEVSIGYEELDTPGLQSGTPGVVVAVRPQADANILAMTDAVEEVVTELNETELVPRGVRLDWLADRRPYINAAIDLLKTNIAFGGSLAIIALMLFLRSITSTLVVAAAIPISVIGSFIFMRAFGTTLNVVSLAGIAFAVGMLVDNAIVVLENIDRHRKMGKGAFRASYDGTREVWGAVFASSLTTVAVFLPVLFLEQEAGLLFRDIAVAVTCAVSISLIVSVSVIPMFSRQLYGSSFLHRFEKPLNKTSFIGRFGEAVGDAYMVVVRGALYNTVTRLATIVILSGSAIAAAYIFFPKMEYLPQGNRALIINIMIPPPGLSYEERLAIGEFVHEYLEPYYGESKDGYPPVERTFYIGRGQSLILGVICGEQQRTAELIPLCQEMMGSIPGVFGISNQASIFQQGLGRGRTIDVDLRGGDLDQLVAAAGRMMGAIRERIDDVQIRPQPSLDMLFPEAQFKPDPERLRAVGMTATQFGIALDVLNDGRQIADYKQEGQKKIDLVVMVDESDIGSPEALNDALMPTPLGTVVPVSSLARLEKTTGLTQIRHLERDRTVSLQVTPPYRTTIQEAMEIVANEIEPQLRAEGALEGVRVGMSGTADKLTETRQALQMNFLLAAAITYLLMSALFGNFFYPLIIMLTVPLAGTGGLVGLKLINVFIAPQQLDILTMLGFIILIGVVVNNAILIVHQSLNNVRYERMAHYDAVIDATRSRLRPIYMTAVTSLSGMLPLVLYPGPGSELYRGLGSVVLGGLALSTIFTVFLIPAMLLFFIGMEKPASDEEAQEEAAAKSSGESPTADPVPVK